jgi:DNA-directed RNA polymerase I subunit RPA2
MIRKLFSLVSGICCPDNPDSPQHQEILLPGILYGMIIKEKLDETLLQIQTQVLQDTRRDHASVDFFDGASIFNILEAARHTCMQNDTSRKYSAE